MTSPTWQSPLPPPQRRISLFGWGLVAVRASLTIALATLGMVALLVVRGGERLRGTNARPWSPYVVQMVTRLALLIIGLRYRRIGSRMAERGAVVANHSSWIDILSLNAGKRVYFVAKSEVARWPVIGWMARVAGTVFIRRSRQDARLQHDMFEEHLTAGRKLLFFPEGTSTDGMQVLDFKSTLFAAFLTPKLRDILWVQPVSVVYTAPDGEDPRFYGWWGDMGLASHMAQIFSAWRPGAVDVIYHPPLRVADYADRKALAAAAGSQVRAGVPLGRLTRSA